MRLRVCVCVCGVFCACLRVSCRRSDVTGVTSEVDAHLAGLKVECWAKEKSGKTSLGEVIVPRASLPLNCEAESWYTLAPGKDTKPSNLRTSASPAELYLRLNYQSVTPLCSARVRCACAVCACWRRLTSLDRACLGADGIASEGPDEAAAAQLVAAPATKAKRARTHLPAFTGRRAPAQYALIYLYY